jgi:hypothetical protein
MASASHYDIFLVDYHLNSPLTGIDWVDAMHKNWAENARPPSCSPASLMCHP